MFYFAFFFRATAVFEGDFFLAVAVVLGAEVLRFGFSPSGDTAAALRVRLGLASCGGLGKAACCEGCNSPPTVGTSAIVRRRRAGLVTRVGSSGTRSDGGGASTAGGAGRRFHGAIERDGSRGAVWPVGSAAPSGLTRKMWLSGTGALGGAP